MCSAPQRRSGPRMACFVHFDLEMCSAPQRRALFRHLNFQKWSKNVALCTFWRGHVLRATTARTFSTFQKWSENGVLLCTFWLGHVLRATTACTFSTSQLPKVVQKCCALYILTWTRASRHNGAHFFDISKVVREWCAALYILTWKCAPRHNGVQFFISHLASWLRTRRFSEVTFRPSGAPNHWKNTSSCFSLFLFSDLLTSWLLLLDCSHLCFSISPYCRKFDF